MAYCPKFGDLAPGRIGNGTLEYEVPLDASLDKSAWRLEGLQAAGKLRVEDGGKEGVLEIRNPTSYVYLKGEAALQAVVGPGGSIGVSFSDNNGLDWREVARIDAGGPRQIDLSKLILRRYDYRLRLVFQGAGTGLDGLRFRHDIQHSQRPLPALDKGENTIVFSAGPQEGTISIEGSSDVANKGRQLVYTDFHPQSRNLKDRLLIDPAKRDGELSYRVETPGDMTRMSIATHYRARDPRGGWDVQVSFDGGKNFKTVSRCAGPAVAFGNFVEVKRHSARHALGRGPLVGHHRLQRHDDLQPPHRRRLPAAQFRLPAGEESPTAGKRRAPRRPTSTWPARSRRATSFAARASRG